MEPRVYHELPSNPQKADQYDKEKDDGKTSTHGRNSIGSKKDASLFMHMGVFPKSGMPCSSAVASYEGVPSDQTKFRAYEDFVSRRILP